MEVLANSKIQWDIQSYECVDSTNRIVKQALAAGAKEGFGATALQQQGGYGRQGRVWESPVGGLYTSLAFCPVEKGIPLENIPLLSLVMSLAVARTLESLVKNASKIAIKWPNDVLYDGGKIAGISLEAVSGGICVGIGINLFPNNNTGEVSGKYRLSYVRNIVVQDELLAEQRSFMSEALRGLLKEIAHAYERWVMEGFAPFIDSYRSSMAFLGSAVCLESIDGSILCEGIIEGVDDGGLLLVRTSSGEVIHASSGEVHIKAFRASSGEVHIKALE